MRRYNRPLNIATVVPRTVKRTYCLDARTIRLNRAKTVQGAAWRGFLGLEYTKSICLKRSYFPRPVYFIHRHPIIFRIGLGTQSYPATPIYFLSKGYKSKTDLTVDLVDIYGWPIWGQYLVHLPRSSRLGGHPFRQQPTSSFGFLLWLDSRMAERGSFETTSSLGPVSRERNSNNVQQLASETHVRRISAFSRRFRLSWSWRSNSNYPLRLS